LQKNIDEDDKSIYIKQVTNGYYTSWFKLDGDVFVKQNYAPYGTVANVKTPILTPEVFLENGTSKTNIWSDSNFLNVGSRNTGGYSKVRTSGIVIQQYHSEERVLLSNGEALTLSELRAKMGL